MILSHPAIFGIVSMYVPLAEYIAPLGAVYESHAETFIESDVLMPRVRLIVITLSQPPMLGIVSMYVPLAMYMAPLGAV